MSEAKECVAVSQPASGVLGTRSLRTHTLCMAPTRTRPEAARTDHTVTDRAQAEGRHGRGHITYCAMIHARCTTNSHTVHGTDKAGGRKPITL